MKEFTEVNVRIFYYANGNVLMSVMSGTDPYADDCYEDEWSGN